MLVDGSGKTAATARVQIAPGSSSVGLALSSAGGGQDMKAFPEFYAEYNRTTGLGARLGKRFVVPPGGAVIGRSRECDIVLGDSNVSRRHAEVRPTGGDSWTITDLDSTNGVKVNGRAVSGTSPLRPGDRLDIGTVDVRFEVE